jgi:hypothetical protein
MRISKTSPSIAERIQQIVKQLFGHACGKSSLLASVLSAETHRRHIMDFFAPQARLVVEVDGSQHVGGDHAREDKMRDGELAALGLKVLRFTSRDVLKERMLW